MNRIIVLIDGAQTTGQRPGSACGQALARFGKLSPVRHDQDPDFDPAKIVQNVRSIIRSERPRRVTFVGASMGALLAYDAISREKTWGTDYKFDLVLIDAPTGLVDLHDKSARFAGLASRLVPAHAPRLSRWILGRGETPQTEELSGPALREFQEHMRLSRKYSFQRLLREGAYIAKHPGPAKEILEGVSGVFLRSAKDEIVASSAHTNWARKFQTGLPRIVVQGSNHVGMLEFPTLWARKLTEAMDYLN